MGRRKSGRAFGESFGRAFEQGAELGTGVMRQRMAQDFQSKEREKDRGEDVRQQRARHAKDRKDFYAKALQDFQKVQGEIGENENRQAIAEDISGSQEKAFKAALAAIAGDTPISEVLGDPANPTHAAWIKDAATATLDRLEAQLPPDDFSDTTRKFLLSDLYNLRSGYEAYTKNPEDSDPPPIRWGDPRQAGRRASAPDFLDYMASVDPFLTYEQVQFDLQDPEIARVVGPMIQQPQSQEPPPSAPQGPGMDDAQRAEKFQMFTAPPGGLRPGAQPQRQGADALNAWMEGPSDFPPPEERGINRVVKDISALGGSPEVQAIGGMTDKVMQPFASGLDAMTDFFRGPAMRGMDASIDQFFRGPNPAMRQTPAPPPGFPQEPTPQSSLGMPQQQPMPPPPEDARNRFSQQMVGGPMGMPVDPEEFMQQLQDQAIIRTLQQQDRAFFDSIDPRVMQGLRGGGPNSAGFR